MWLTLLWSWALAGEATGWRVDGTGHAVDASPPAAWTATWTVALEGWSNATPVPLGDQVCTLVEPAGVSCHDRTTGERRWRAEHPVVEALPPAEQPPARALLASASSAEAELDAVRAAVGALKREVRKRPDASDVAAALASNEARLAELTDVLRKARWLRTPPDQEIMGYTTPTPVSAEGRLYALIANGVVVAHDVDGTLLWRRWLGEAPDHGMRGYDRGHASSPVWIDGTLVVPWGHLRGLDPATGETRWEDPVPWRDYGTPGTTTVGSVGVLFTPDGRMLRARDGKVLQQGLGDITYVGPYALGERVYYLGGPASDATARKGSIAQHGWTLEADGDQVRATALWTTSLELTKVFYTGPVVAEGHLFSIDKSGILRVLDVETGELRSTTDLLGELGGWTYPSPTLAGGLVWVGSGRGRFLGLTPTAEPEVRVRVRLGTQLRATPWFDGTSVYVRTLEGLVRYDAP